MTLPTRSKALLYLLAVFLVGAVAGWTSGYAGAKKRFLAPPRPARMADDILCTYRKELGLTPDQIRQVEPIISATSSNLNQLHQATLEQVRTQIRQSDDRIQQVLTPAQQSKFEELRARRGEWGKRHRNKS